MRNIRHKHVIQKDKDLDKNLAIWLRDIKEDIVRVDGERVFIQTSIREAKDGDIRISTIIGFK